MKNIAVVLSIFLAACGASTPSKQASSSPEIAVEKQAEFRSVGAVVSFEELCLKALATSELAETWEAKHKSQRLKSSPFLKSPEDKAYVIGSDLAQFILVSHKPTGCSVFADNIDGQHVHNTMLQIFLGNKAKNPGSNIKVNTLSKSPVSTHQAVLVSAENEALLDVIISIKPNINGTQSLALTGAIAENI